MLINNYNIDVSKFQQNNEGYWVRKWGKNVTLFNKTHKSCNECGEIKSFIEFDKNNKGVFYLIGKCKECASKIYYQPNKEKYDIHYQTNKQEILNNSKIRYHENDERNKSSYQENKEKIINYKHSNATYK